MYSSLHKFHSIIFERPRSYKAEKDFAISDENKNP